MQVPDSLKFAVTHEWVAAGPGGVAVVGISAAAAEQLGELVYVELPQPGRRVAKGESCAVVESTKAAADVYAPVSGEVVEVNAALADAPQSVNDSPYDAGWLFKLALADPAELDTLMDAAAYRAAVASA